MTMPDTPRRGNGYFRTVFIVGILAFLAYAAWIGGPYLRSVFVRDAAVTSWKQVATAPIAGQIISELPDIGVQIGADTQVALIRNDRLFAEENRVDDLERQMNAAEARIAEIQEFIEHLQTMESNRLGRRKAYARIFRERLRDDIAELKQETAARSRQITVLETLLERLKSVRNEAIPQTRIDETTMRVVVLEREQAHESARLARATERLKLAEAGHYQNNDGSVPAWALDDASDLRLQHFQALMQKHEAQSQLGFLETELKAARATLEMLSETTVHVPQGMTILGIEARPGATVTVGEVLLTWADCSVLFVDVPVSDAELPLIRKGMDARVILEGMKTPVKATVFHSRGSAASLDADNLAAVAKGRDTGTAQVLLSLEPVAIEDNACPIGRAAYVEFPDIGLLDIIRARMRL